MRCVGCAVFGQQFLGCRRRCDERREHGIDRRLRRSSIGGSGDPDEQDLDRFALGVVDRGEGRVDDQTRW
jgi:hypothetical protein